MNKKLKKALQNAFEPPKPIHEKEFIKQFPQPTISTLSFVLSQIRYIQKYVWIVSFAVFLIALMGARAFEKDVLWVISALIPFIALSLVTENARSNTYSMAEFEMSARFSLKSIVLARMGILGGCYLILLVILIPLSAAYSVATVFQVGLYLLVPYLLTTCIGLLAVRKVHGKEAIYVCMGIAISVSGLNMFIRTIFPYIYTNEYNLNWLILLLIIGVSVIVELRKNIKQTEELTWSFS